MNTGHKFLLIMCQFIFWWIWLHTMWADVKLTASSQGHCKDEMVFKLYDLTYEEVNVISPDFWLREEEYEAIK